MPKAKSVRVWVAVDDEGPMPAYCGIRKETAEWGLQSGCPDWQLHGITIRRATLTLDPVKPKKRRKA